MLEAQICDAWGVALAGGTIYYTSSGGGLEVIDPLNDSRTARLTVSMYDRCSKFARPLDRVLSVTYGTHLIFKGPILSVSRDFQEGKVTIFAHDPTIKLKHHYHRYGDWAVDAGYTLDGRGMQTLVESSLDWESETDSGIPPNGILWGYDNTTHRDDKTAAKRGQNVWDSVVSLSQIVGGPDFRFRPVDKYHDGKYPASLGIHDLGFMVELDTNDHLGTDKQDEVIFEAQIGQDNAENILHEPDGDVVRNYFTQVAPGGPRNRNDEEKSATVKAGGSIHDYGFYEGYESSGNAKDPVSVLRARAQDWVGAYARPPAFFTVTPRIANEGVPRYPADVVVGDTIRARARKGECSFDGIGRIVKATVKSIDQSGNSRVDLDCVPTILETIDDA
jgi:hypothetical protein